MRYGFYETEHGEFIVREMENEQPGRVIAVVYDVEAASICVDALNAYRPSERQLGSMLTAAHKTFVHSVMKKFLLEMTTGTLEEKWSRVDAAIEEYTEVSARPFMMRYARNG